MRFSSWMTACSLTLLLTAPVLAGDLESFAGSWSVTAITADGKEPPPDYLKDRPTIYKYEGNKYSITQSGQEMESGTIAVSEEGGAKRVDHNAETGPDKGKPQKGLFKIDGDTLVLSVMKDGSTPPKEIAGGPGQMVITLKREAAAPASPASPSAAPASPEASPSASPAADAGEDDEEEDEEEDAEDEKE